MKGFVWVYKVESDLSIEVHVAAVQKWADFSVTDLIR